jgi:hypothetical protein
MFQLFWTEKLHVNIDIDMVIHTYNPNYLGGGDLEAYGLGPP